MTEHPKGKKVITLWSYFGFSESIYRLMRAATDPHFTTDEEQVKAEIRAMDREDQAMHLALFCYWYASLYVVIEGWQELKLKDAAVDATLTSKHVDLLRRFRNGVFHFQKSLNDRKFTDWMLDAPDAVEWVFTVRAALAGYFERTIRKRSPEG